MQTLLVASRKGLFVVRGQGAQWAVVGHHFAGDPVTQVLAGSVPERLLIEEDDLKFWIDPYQGLKTGF